MALDISIIIPLYNEVESLAELHSRIKKVMRENQWSHEIFFVDDGSTDKSWELIEQLSENDKNVIGIKFRRNLGKTQALSAAFASVEGRVVFTMDADLQDRPEEIPALYNKLKEGYDLVSGWKQDRKDPKLTKNIPSFLFNWVARATSGVKIHDFNCGLKAMNKEVVKSLDLYGDMHRYIPVLAKNKGFGKITEQKIVHDARKHGKSKFGADRFIRGFLDLITLWFTHKFMHRPMHFFGAIGTSFFLVGFLSAFYIGVEKLYFVANNIPARLVTDDPFFYISLTCMLLGSQLFLAGFITEVLARTRVAKHSLEIEKQTNRYELDRRGN